MEGQRGSTVLSEVDLQYMDVVFGLIDAYLSVNM